MLRDITNMQGSPKNRRLSPINTSPKNKQIQNIDTSELSPRYSLVSDVSPMNKSLKPKISEEPEFIRNNLENEVINLNRMVWKKHNPSLAYLDISYTVYHLYNNGTMTTQPGGINYMRRNEHVRKVGFLGITEGLEFVFPLRTQDGSASYAILNEHDANFFRTEMASIIMRSKQI